MSRRSNQRAHPHVPSRRSPRFASRGETSPTNPEELEQLDPQEQIGDQEPENATEVNMVEGQAEAPVFALTPAQANASNTLDYSSQADVKICNKASSELSQKFDCNSKNVSMFCEKLKDRAQESGWETADGDITNIPDSKGVNLNLITEHGRLTEADIRNHALGYMTNPS